MIINNSSSFSPILKKYNNEMFQFNYFMEKYYVLHNGEYNKN